MPLTNVTLFTKVSKQVTDMSDQELVRERRLLLFLGIHHTTIEVTEELPAGLVQVVQEGIGENYELESVGVSYDELGFQLDIRIVGDAPAPAELAKNARLTALAFYDRAVRVRLVTRVVLKANGTL